MKSGRSVFLRHPLDHVAGWHLVCVAAVIAIIWIHEMVDLPALLFGGAREPADYAEGGLLTTFVLLIGGIAIIPIQFHRRRSMGKSVTICSYCRRVQVDERTWDQIEQFFAQKTYATYSHGVCPDCCSKVMTAYRSGKKDAGAREPLSTEVLV